MDSNFQLMPQMYDWILVRQLKKPFYEFNLILLISLWMFFDVCLVVVLEHESLRDSKMDRKEQKIFQKTNGVIFQRNHFRLNPGTLSSISFARANPLPNETAIFQQVVTFYTGLFSSFSSLSATFPIYVLKGSIFVSFGQITVLL